jgi:hypothetical protein
MRRILGLTAAAVVAALGALVLGEYAFDGVAVVFSGALLGLFVAEAAAAAGERSRPLAVASGALTALGLVWAGWISTGHRLGAVPGLGWAAVAVGALVAALTGLQRRTPARTGRPSPPPR